MQKLFRGVSVAWGKIRAELRQIYSRYFGTIQRFDGNAKEICEQIVDLAWQGDYYKTSLGHFDFFFVRDFGTVAESLVVTGHKKHVLHTLKWALRHYRDFGSVTTCIDPRGSCFNAPMHAVDSLPWLLSSLIVSGYDLNQSEKYFIETELTKYCKKYLDATGHLRSMKMGEMRDAVLYDRSAYAVTLVGRLAYCAEQLELENFPYSMKLYADELTSQYWNGAYFNADRVTTAFSADSALMPFFLGVIEDKPMFEKTYRYIIENAYNKPFPLLYTKTPEVFKYHWWMTAPIMPNYEGHSLWSWHGLFYLHSLQRFNMPTYQSEKRAFAQGMIEAHGTFPEMLNADGSWYYSSIYRGDPGMVWAALYVALPQE